MNSFPLRFHFSFEAVLLFKTRKAKFERLVEDDLTGFDMEVHERVIVEGTISKLKTPLIHEDFKNLEDVKRILKYIDKGKLDLSAWSNALDLHESLNRLLDEHKEYIDHMKYHH